MSQWLGFTNQKLYQARLLLDKSAQEEGPTALNDALEQGGLYLLYDAYVSYLNEVATVAHCPTPVESLDALLTNTPLVTGEMTELRVLFDDSYSWLTAMLRAISDQAQPGSSSPSVMPVKPSGNLIAASSEPTSNARQWWQSLSDLIDSQRENRQES